MPNSISLSLVAHAISVRELVSVTIACLEMNSQAQVTARQLWIRLGLFP
jgi:hypothetical protein